MAGIPTEQVLYMRKQGLSNNQIIQNLQRQGHTQTEIFDALNQADISNNVGEVGPDIPPDMMENPMQMTPQQDPAAQQNYSYSQQPQGYDYSQQGYGGGNEQYVEAVVAEKWEQFQAHLHKIEEWKEQTDVKLSKLENDFTSLKDSFDKLHKAIIGKIGEYDQNILNVGTEIKAMEKVFQKLLPTFTENVNELSRYTDKLKQAPPPRK